MRVSLPSCEKKKFRSDVRVVSVACLFEAKQEGVVTGNIL